MTNSLLSAQTFLSSLPEELPVFPLSGAVLLPHARLPLTVSDPRHIAMVEDALGNGRMLGIVQPMTEKDIRKAPLYSIGCAGRITSFNEVEDGNLLIVLTGVCRFRIIAELDLGRPYRMVNPEWTPFLSDLGENDPVKIDRERLIDLMQIYFSKNGISANWCVVKDAPDDLLILTIIMVCPFAANEKQALLEAPTLSARAEMLIALLEMAALPQAESDAELKH